MPHWYTIFEQPLADTWNNAREMLPSDSLTEIRLIGLISRTVSEARSYDETTIHPPMRSLHHIFHNSRTHTCDSKHSSSHKDVRAIHLDIFLASSELHHSQSTHAARPAPHIHGGYRLPEIFPLLASKSRRNIPPGCRKRIVTRHAR